MLLEKGVLAIEEAVKILKGDASNRHFMHEANVMH